MAGTDREIIRLLVTAGDEPVATSAIADELGISHPGAWRRLEKLAAAGIVKRQVDGDAMGDLWLLTAEARDEFRE